LLNAHEGGIKMTLPLFILSIFSVTIGFLTKDLFIGIGSDFLNQSIFILYSNYSLTDIEFINIFYKLLPLFFTCLGSFLSYFLYAYRINFFFLLKTNLIFIQFYTFFNKKWFFDRIYNQFVVQSVFFSANDYSYKLIDRGFLEVFFAQGIENFFFKTISKLKKVQTGNISQYLFIFFYSIFCFFLIVVNFF